ncbi:MAG: VWA domain-containing protein, partial [Chloroflexi bacterium CFX6]|nr:VWA domain-containing protein [Chloroflexi bacterium CFX6]
VIVLLTDGEQVESPEAAGRAARAVRQARVRMYAVGLGAQVDPTALAALTGEPAQVYIAPSPAELAAIYAQVAGEIPCPRAAFWGGR